MRTNAFGEPYIQPGDDFGDIWTERFGEEPEDVFARLIEEDETGWGCEVADNRSDAALYVEGFTSREKLVEFLESWDIEVTE